MARSDFRCGVIEESLLGERSLAGLKPYLVASRTALMPHEDPAEWHVNEYLVPHDALVALLPFLEVEIREGWYAHAFNVEQDALHIVLRGRSFLLPTTRDARWDPMIQYEREVGCDPPWTENIPLSV